MDRVHQRRLMGLRTSLNANRWLPDRWLRLNQSNRYLGFKSRSFIADSTAEAAGSGRGRRQLTLAAAHRAWARRFAGVWVFSSYGGRLSMRFAPTGSQRRGERVYANLNQQRAATKPGNSKAARPVFVDGEGSLRWSFSSKDMRQGFLKLPSSFSTDQLLWSTAENSNLVAT
jgi:hypothetical protein